MPRTRMARAQEIPPTAAGDPAGLPWFRRLQTQFWLLGLLLVTMLAVAGWQIGRTVVYDTLTRDVFLYETESGRRLQTRISALTDRAEVLAATLAELAAAEPPDPANPTPAVTDIVDVADPDSRFTSIGIWPQPTADGQRRSRLWLRDAVGQLQPRDDYNDPRVVSYAEAGWFVAARFVTPHRCYWSPVRVQRLNEAALVSCSTPIVRDGRFAGVITVGISIDTLEAEFERSTAGDPGYSLLIDADHRVLATSNTLGSRLQDHRPANLAALAQQYPALNPMALDLFNARKDFRSRMARSPAYDAAQISALAEASSEMTRDDAEGALVPIWARLMQGDDDTPSPRVLQIRNDPALAGDANATVLALPHTGWTLVRVRAAREGFSGARALFHRVLWLTVAGVMIAMVVLTVVLHWQILRPLRRMSRTLAQSSRLDESLDVVLDASAQNELGTLAHLYNDRTRQLRDLMDSALNANAQMTIEATHRRDLQLSLDALQQQHLAVLNHGSDGVVQTDGRGRIEMLNPAAERLTGLRAADVRGRIFGEVLVAGLEGDDAPLPDLASAAIERGQNLNYSEGAYVVSALGDQIPTGVQVLPIRGSGGRMAGTIVLLRPLDGGGEIASTEVGISAEDPLTGLPGRPACEQHLRNLLHAAQLQPREHALLVLDLDHFERLNATHDTIAGNECLQRVADTLRHAVGRRGQVYRLVSDQFAVVLEQFELDRARIFADALRDAVARQSHPWGGRSLHLTTSIGLTRLHGDSDAAAQVLREADDACQAAKREGRNRVRQFDPSVARGTPGIDDAVWVRRIRAGIDNDRFHLTTQFVQSMPGNPEPGGVFEVLLALEDEEGFWASPDAFMSVAERHELTVEMDRWVVSRTLRYLQQTPDVLAGLGFVVINLSPASMADPDWLHWLVQQFEQHPDVAPRKLCFELRQATLLRHPQQATLFCDAMRAMGCRVSVDHFVGSDRETLQQIRALAVDVLKINALHYRQLSIDPVEQMLAETAIKLARTLQKQVVVFNVPDSGLLSAWQRMGIDYLQGHAVAKPTPVIFSVPSR
ncbi:EAL domain-containing protein [Flagellatimonas centrodinii]|uniref:EAL domain-containing protein n=1 Tax=Flagellatimonas centrodinii TaxID=2806210 RepID=UPI001FEDBF5A|nr:EAL domain-containing protein [Flagellatimonas centrodinii]ULQ46153.1 EAL domain-containing protein [Flagellatimonas centrodinii]